MSKQVANHPFLAAEDLSYLLIDMGSTVFLIHAIDIGRKIHLADQGKATGTLMRV